jgi:hypothetical protein
MAAFSASAWRRCMKVAVIAAVAFVGGLAADARPVVADQPAPCADGFILVPAASVPSGDKKDKNNNGLVCGKFDVDRNLTGGPDDDTIV